jgi:para-nitrobenzyl esterase
MPSEDVIVVTSTGTLRGDRSGDVCIFKGVPYGAPTGGFNRFRPPQKPHAWTGVRDARTFGNGCWQNFVPSPPGTLSHDFFKDIFDTDETWKLQGEDCLVLNIWTPAVGAGKRPVMVWFHGGSFTQGCGSSRLYDGTRLALRGDTVIVTVNHRLNVFGHLHLSDLDPHFAGSGNAGVLDLVSALEWVRDNVSAFGGDPQNVTIFGESGGGGKVSTLMAMPSAEGLFHRAIVQSGASVRANVREDGTKLARLLLVELGLSEGNLAPLQEIEAPRLLAAATAAEAKFGRNMFDGSFGSWAPLVDGASLPRHPFDPDAPPLSKRVPLMIGTTKDETSLALASLPGFASMTLEQIGAILTPILGLRTGAAVDAFARLAPEDPPGQILVRILTDFLAAEPALKVAERKARAGDAPVFHYVMTWETPVLGGLLRSVHALDIPFMFDNVESSRSVVGPGPVPQHMADIMSDTWLAFARNGVPDNTTIPNWPAYDESRRATMLFDREPKTVDGYAGETRALWASHMQPG